MILLDTDHFSVFMDERDMSEYQRIAFRAIDGPLSEESLAFMRRQSSRAEVTPTSFDNEYQFGDFRGNAIEMLRRGYDLHLHYANFGIRKLLIRLPHGLPDLKAARPYLGNDALKLLQDKEGPAATLSIVPFHEPGDLDEPSDLDGLLDRLVPLRAEILDGDLRPLYLAHLAIACDGNHDPEETKEGPVPAGLDRLSDAQHALAELYDLSDALIAAAAQGCPGLPGPGDPRNQCTEWLQHLPQATKDAWLAELMTGPHSSVRREVMAEFRKSRSAPSWPTACRNRTIAELETAADVIQEETNRNATAHAAAQRAAQLARMAADPAETLRQTEELVNRRSIDAYQQVATLLADLRAALAGTKQSGMAEEQARKLKKKNPTLARLTAELRRVGFLVK